ncbi:universal stress protein [Aeromonas bivalvium]|uniref:universal stress protein n=1 Tax=Aeromonas TaxID=642 RepID=UPI001F44D407|nr:MULTISPECIES: universal stress protein [Aeromonas]MCE9945703.1 universal stress protein [Aeromonas rivipollensis]MCE9951089.1 universal stress protein [Aeromonas allosaccharophila]MCE9958321.1 universal stress protein [Aeromonas rivipollensis]MDF8327869.1 universal stress protein [Aeromonas salmonicida]MDM5137306.1 universal stress protein [Aeromonas salmonicida]
MTNIFACIDGSPAMTAVCDAAAWASTNTGLPVTLLHALEKNEFEGQADLSGNIGLGSREQLLKELAELDHQRSRLAHEQGRILLNSGKEYLADLGMPVVDTLQRHGQLVETTQELSSGMRMLIMGKQGTTHAHELIGRNIESVIRTLSNPIMVVQPGFQTPSRFLFAYDASPTAKKVLELIASSPLLKGLECELVMVGEPSDEHERQLAQAKQVLKSAGIRVEAMLLQGEVVPMVCQHAADMGCNLIVMGAYGHSRIRQFIVGSTTTGILKTAESSVLLLR